MTAACTFDIRVVQIITDGAAEAGGQGGADARDASQDASDARAGADGAGGQGGRSDASVDGNAGASGSGGAGKGGAGGSSGSSGSSGTAGAGGSGGSGGSGGTAGAAGSAGIGGIAGAAGVAGLAGAAGIAGLTGAGGVAGLTGAGGTTGGTGGSDGGTTDGAAGQSGGIDAGTDARDIWVADSDLVDASDGGTVVFFTENFDSALGAFTVQNDCGTSAPVWSNNAGYAHATDPAILGVSSISSPSVTVPANVSQIRLRLSHKVGTEAGYHGGQLLVSVNSGTPAMVTNFTAGPYVNGSSVNPDTCTERPEPSWVSAWSGNLPEFESEANLSGAPFNVAAGDTVSIRFRMLTDSFNPGNGWDINWVRLTGTAQ